LFGGWEGVAIVFALIMGFCLLALMLLSIEEKIKRR